MMRVGVGAGWDLMCCVGIGCMHDRQSKGIRLSNLPLAHESSGVDMQSSGKMGGDPSGCLEQGFENRDDGDDDGDDDWDDEITFGCPRPSRPNQKNALDTLSTIDEDSDWDEVDRVHDLLKTFDDRAAMVQPGLFIGAFLAEQNKEELEKKGITHILQACTPFLLSTVASFWFSTSPVSRGLIRLC